MMENIYDNHLIIKRLISSQVVQCRWDGNNRQIFIDKDISDSLNSTHPEASELLLYLSIHMGNNNVAYFTMSEIMRVTGLNRTAVRRALGILTDLDYALPLRENPASLMMI